MWWSISSPCSSPFLILTTSALSTYPHSQRQHQLHAQPSFRFWQSLSTLISPATSLFTRRLLHLPWLPLVYSKTRVSRSEHELLCAQKTREVEENRAKCACHIALLWLMNLTFSFAITSPCRYQCWRTYATAIPFAHSPTFTHHSPSLLTRLSHLSQFPNFSSLVDVRLPQDTDFVRCSPS